MLNTLEEYLKVLILKGYVGKVINNIYVKIGNHRKYKLMLSDIVISKNKKDVTYNIEVEPPLSKDIDLEYLLASNIVGNNYSSGAELTFTDITGNIKHEYIKKFTISTNLVEEQIDKFPNISRIVCTPTLEDVRKRLMHDAENYASTRYYIKGEYCSYRGEIYKCIREGNRGKFKPSYWNKEPMITCDICLHLAELPMEFVKSVSYKLGFLDNDKYNLLTSHGNTVINYEKYEKILNYFTKQRKTNSEKCVVQDIKKALSVDEDDIQIIHHGHEYIIIKVPALIKK